MFLICLSLLGLITIAILAEKEFESASEAEFIPVRVDERESLKR